MNLQAIRIFIKIVEAGNITKASDAFDIPRATLSRNLKQLEDDLGVVLIERTTRYNQLTEAGELFYLKIKTILTEFDELEKEVATEQSQISGRLTFAMPSLFISIGCVDMVSFQRQYPELQLVVKNLEAGLDSGMELGFDLAIQVDSPSDSSFIMVRLGELSFDYFASEEYLIEHGEPMDPDDLENHFCIYSPIKLHDPKSWRFGSKEIKPSFSCVFERHDQAAEFARSHMGVCCIPVIANSVRLNGNLLKPLFNSEYRFSRTVYGIYPSKRHMPIKLMILLERLKNVLPEVLQAYEDS